MKRSPWTCESASWPRTKARKARTRRWPSASGVGGDGQEAPQDRRAWRPLPLLRAQGQDPTTGSRAAGRTHRRAARPDAGRDQGAAEHDLQRARAALCLGCGGTDLQKRRSMPPSRTVPMLRRPARTGDRSRTAPSRLVFLDESAAKTNMTRLRGRAPRGERLVASCPHGTGRRPR